MSYFKVAQGVYYLLSGSHILSSWLGSDYDYAQKEVPHAVPVKGKSLLGDYGFLGFQAGLHADQTVDETFWNTRIPFETHFKRNRKEWPDGRPSGVPAEVEWFLEVDWYHVGTPAQAGALPPLTKFQSDSIRFVGKDDFVEVKIPEMASQNTDGGAFTLLSDTSAAASSKKVTAATKHPKYFRIIQPPSSVGVLSPMKLTWRAKMVPGSGLSRKALARWFDPDAPGQVSFHVNPDSMLDYQQIDYDYFIV